jgi:RND family efflux transporter MFP subunit
MLLPGRTAAPPPPQDPVANVRVEPVRVISGYRPSFTMPGSVEADDVMSVATEAAGAVADVFVREGQVVRAGQRLAKIDDAPLIEVDGRMIPAQLAQAQAQAQFDELELAKTRELAAKGFAKDFELRQMETKAALSHAALKLAQDQWQKTDVVAPVGGVLNKLLMKKGEYAAPGKPFAQIVNVGYVKIAIDVPERLVSMLKVWEGWKNAPPPTSGDIGSLMEAAAATGSGLAPGDDEAIEITVQTPGGPQSFFGHIWYIDKLADPATRTTRVEIRVPNPDGKVPVGTIVGVTLAPGKPRDAILVPLQTITPLEKGDYQVYVVADGVARPRRVVMATLQGDKVELRADQGELKPGELLIVDGHRDVGPGQKVVIRQAASAPGGPASRPAPASASAPAPAAAATAPKTPADAD